MGSDKIFMFDNPAAGESAGIMSIYDMLNDSEKEILFGIAQSMGMTRVERRKMKRKYEKRR